MSDQPLCPYQTYFKSCQYCRSLTTFHGKFSKAIEVDLTILTKSLKFFDRNASLIPRYFSESIGSQAVFERVVRVIFWMSKLNIFRYFLHQPPRNEVSAKLSVFEKTQKSVFASKIDKICVDFPPPPHGNHKTSLLRVTLLTI